jgi:hypothetical protein
MHIDMDGLIEMNQKQKMLSRLSYETKEEKQTIHSLHSFSLLLSFDKVEFLNKSFRCSSDSSSLLIDG